jgi:signal transduction histidine kinase
MFQVEAEARAVLAGLKDLARRQLVRFELAVQPGLAIDGDGLALRSVLTELIAHAARRAAGGRVLVAASKTGHVAEIAVCDDGRVESQGLEEDLRSVRQLAAQLDATVEARSADVGTTVTFRVPLAPSPGGAAQGRAAAASQGRSK